MTLPVFVCLGSLVHLGTTSGVSVCWLLEQLSKYKTSYMSYQTNMVCTLGYVISYVRQVIIDSSYLLCEALIKVPVQYKNK